MKGQVRLQAILTEAGGDLSNRLAVFALLNLGLIESLTKGLLSASDAVRDFFNADNCLFVR